MSFINDDDDDDDTVDSSVPRELTNPELSESYDSVCDVFSGNSHSDSPTSRHTRLKYLLDVIEIPKKSCSLANVW